VEDEKKKNVMRAQTLTQSSKQSDDSPGSHWEDLPDSVEKKNVKLSKKQRVTEELLRTELLKHWDEIFEVAVQKKGRKIILSKDEYSIDFNIKNRRELILPPEYYINMTVLEKYYMNKDGGTYVDSSWDISTLRMYLARRYDIKSDFIHLSNISRFCKVPMVDLVRKRYKPLQNKLLQKVKKRIKLRNANKNVIVSKHAKKLTKDKMEMVPSHGKIRSHAIKVFKKESNEVDQKSNASNEDDKYSNISDNNKAPRMSLLDLIVRVRKCVKDLKLVFKKFSKENKQGKGFMNIHSFSSFLGVILDLRLTSVNKRGLFSTIDSNKDGYVTDKDFFKIFSITQEEIELAISQSKSEKEIEMLDFVIEQIYYDIVFFDNKGLTIINSKLDKNGLITLKKLEQYLAFYKVILAPYERTILTNQAVENELTGEKLIPFRKIFEKTISKSNLKVEFKTNFVKQGTSIRGDNDKKGRMDYMEKFYDEEARKKEEEEEKRRAEEALNIEDSDFSQFENSDDSVMQKSKIARSSYNSANKELSDIKDKFGTKFLDIFQKSLLDAISKDKTGKSFHPRKGQENLLPGNKFHNLSSTNAFTRSNNEMPQFLVYNYQNYDSIYKLNKNGQNKEFINIPPGLKTLQGNVNYYRNGSSGLSRRLIQKFGVAQKYWPNGRPRGSLERLSNNYRSTITDYHNPAMQVGIQGHSLRRHHRISTSIDTNQRTMQQLGSDSNQSVSNAQILKAIENLSNKYGTPFTVEGHKEKFIDHIRKDSVLRENLLSLSEIKPMETIKPIQSIINKEEKGYFSVPASAEKSRAKLVTRNPMKNITVKKSAPKLQAVNYVPSADGSPNKKYLVHYMNSKPAEKEKIMTLFTKLFKEYHFNKKEDKDLILRHIR